MRIVTQPGLRLFRVLVNLAAWVVGLLALAVIGVPICCLSWQA